MCIDPAVYGLGAIIDSQTDLRGRTVLITGLGAIGLLVVQMAKTQNQLFGSTENYLVTREFERIATHEQKLALLDCLFAVTAADETITGAEDNVVKQIASELRLSHSEYIASRSRFREYLAVLKQGRRDP